MSKIRVGLCQTAVKAGVEENLKAAAEAVQRAAGEGAQIVCLPEMFCCPYANSSFRRHAQRSGGEIWSALAEMAARNAVWLIGGSMPELDNGRLYNTCFIFAPDGQQAGRYRKVHLFDVDIPGRQYFKESDTLSAGESITVIETPLGKIGAAICFDLRFGELFRLMALRGADMIFVPGAFNMTTGPAHWELLFRARAVDQQCWMLGCAPAQCAEAGYVSYGHSLAVSPWGEVCGQLDEHPGVLIAEIDTELSERVRHRLPVLSARRTDVYTLAEAEK